jgi:hypothetical protein
MSTKGANVYEREKLYEEVWNAPVIRVAKLYGVSNVAIKKICKSMNIPTPSNGYWAKLRNGKKVQKTPLPPTKKCKHLIYGIDKNKEGTSKTDPLFFLNDEEREKVYSITNALSITNQNDLCKELQDHRLLVETWNKENSSMEGLRCSYREYWYRHSVHYKEYSTIPPLFAGVLSIMD